MRSVAAELEALEDAQPQQSAIKFDLERFSKYEVLTKPGWGKVNGTCRAASFGELRF